MRIRRRTLLAALAGLAGLALAAPAAADEGPKVRAVLFWDRGCPNCEIVIQEVLPAIEPRYGSRLEIVRAEMSSIRAFDAYMLAAEHFAIPQERQGVPLLVMGDEVMMGADEIGERLEPAIEEGLANGGLDLLPALGLTEADVQNLQSESAAVIAEMGAAVDPPSAASAATRNPLATAAAAQDPVATMAAAAVLLFMALALIYVLVAVWRAAPAAGAMSAPANGSAPSIWLAVLSVAGLFVAGYLSYVKLAQSGTFCPIGECEAVQHSAYASLLGVPIAYLGFLTYVLLMGLWLAARYGRDGWRGMASLGIAGVSLFGTIFSAYLTYLEIFVIQAVCIWCLASAVIMTLILIVAVRDAVARVGPSAEETAALAT